MSEDNSQPSFEQTGIIYMITSPSGKKYIGQHKTNNINTRKKTHLSSFIKFNRLKIKLEENPDANTFPNKGSRSLYEAFNEYGHENFIWSVVKDNIQLCDLNEEENKYIIEFNTMSPNGHNLKLNNASEEHKMYSGETLARMSISQSKVYETRLENYRKYHDELEGVGQFVTYFVCGDMRGYRIQNHPQCSFKQFADATTPVPELKSQLLAFMKECESKTYITTQKAKLVSEVPKNIQEQKPGHFMVMFVHKGNKYEKYFSMPPRELALTNAIKWLEAEKVRVKDIAKIIKEPVQKEIPGLYRRSNGYEIQFACNKIRYFKAFNSALNSIAENRVLAVEWMNLERVRVKNIIIKEEGPETK